jgi:uncharacterized lipoprotein YmbA
MPAPAPGGLSYRVGVGPVTVPAAVDRPQIVLRVDANRVALQEQSRWAEPLKESIPRVVASNLAVLLGMRRLPPMRRTPPCPPIAV